MEDTCPVGVIIPCYCCANTIERAVQSVFAQATPPSEIWLIDDASPDGGATREALQRVARRAPSATRVEVIEFAENRGPSAARNRGWDATSQPLVAFLDADDTWHPRKLELQYRWMRAHENVALTCHLQPRWQEGQALEDGTPWTARQIFATQLLRSNRITTSSVMLRRDLAQRFSTQLRRCEDQLLWLLKYHLMPIFQQLVHLKV